MMMRELTDAETNEVAGGGGAAAVAAAVQADPGDTIAGTGEFVTAASGTTALAAITATYSGLAGTPTATLAAAAVVTP
jgi:hypothetical protein